MNVTAMDTGRVHSRAVTARQLDSDSWQGGNDTWSSILTLTLLDVEISAPGQVTFHYTYHNEPTGPEGGFFFFPILEFRVDGEPVHEERPQQTSPGETSEFTVTVDAPDVTPGLPVEIVVVGLHDSGNASYADQPYGSVGATLPSTNGGDGGNGDTAEGTLIPGVSDELALAAVGFALVALYLRG